MFYYILYFLITNTDYELNYNMIHRNKPESLFGEAVCGNGFVEQGEQCDCGLAESCDGNKCCDPSTCMFYHSNVTCATGECCDQKVTSLSSSISLQCKNMIFTFICRHVKFYLLEQRVEVLNTNVISPNIVMVYLNIVQIMFIKLMVLLVPGVMYVYYKKKL